LQRDGSVAVQQGAVFNLLFRQIDLNAQTFFIDCRDRVRRDEDLLADQPGTRFDDQITDCPAKIVKEDVADGAYLSVETAQSKAVDFFCVKQLE
jgi:hypothetical protein